jgi:hypothetical protein
VIVLLLRSIVETLKITNHRLERLAAPRVDRVERITRHEYSGRRPSDYDAQVIADALSQNSARERARKISMELNQWEIQGDPSGSASEPEATEPSQ